MTVALDASEAFRREPVGIGKYARLLVKELLEVSHDSKVILLGIREAGVDTSFARSEAVKLLWSPTYRSVWSYIRLPLHLWRHHYDLFHSMAHKLPLYVPRRTVVTIHDLGFMRFPDTVGTLHRERSIWFAKDAVRRATRVIAISQNTKDDLCRLFRVPAEKIDVVYHGVDHSIYRPDVPATCRSSPYILSVGVLQPRKNYETLIQAFELLCAMRSEKVELVIVGKPGWMYRGIEEAAATSKFADRIHLLGYVHEDNMPGLYAGAALFAMPSLYEGFGIPLLEAMSCGVPVIASLASSIPEVVGNGGLLLDPMTAGLWAEAMQEILESPVKREELRRKALEQAAVFSWRRTATETFRVYEKTINTN